MPRLPPVTRTTWPSNPSGGMSNLEERVQRLEVLDVVHRRAREDLFHPGGEGTLRTDLDKGIDADPRQPEDAGRPAHRARELAHHEFPDLRRFLVHLGVG